MVRSYLGKATLVAGLATCLAAGLASLGSADSQVAENALPKISIVRYDIALTPDFEHNSMSNHVVCRLRNDSEKPVSEIDFDILAWEKRVGVSVIVDRVSQVVRKKALPLEFSRGKVDLPRIEARSEHWRQVPQVTRVKLASPLARGATTELVFDYSWDSLNTSDQDAPYRLIGTFPSGEKELYLIMDFTWFPQLSRWPSRDFRETKADWRVSLAVPGSYVGVVPDGVCVKTEERGGKTISHWKSCAPGQPQVLASSYDKVVVKKNQVPVEFYLVKGARNQKALENYAEFLTTAYSTFSKLFGPLDKKEIVVAESRVNGGHGAYLGYIDEAGRIEKKWASPPRKCDILGAHELAHGWWGGSVAGVGRGERFLHESFADWSTAYLLQQMDGLDWFRFDTVKSLMHGTHNQQLIYPDHDDVRAAYSKGPIVLDILRQEMGNKAFFRVLKTFANRYKGKQATIQDFVTTCNSVSGKDWTGFMKHWLYGTGCPNYQLAGFESKQENAGWKTTVTVRNAGKGTITCPIELRMASGTRVQRFHVAEGATESFSYPTPAQVTEVVIDPEHCTLQGDQKAWVEAVLALPENLIATGDGLVIRRRSLAYLSNGDLAKAEADMATVFSMLSADGLDIPACDFYIRGVISLREGKLDAGTADLAAFLDRLMQNPRGGYLAPSGIVNGTEVEVVTQYNDILRRITGADLQCDPASETWDQYCDGTAKKWQAWWAANKATFRLAESAKTLPGAMGL